MEHTKRITLAEFLDPDNFFIEKKVYTPLLTAKGIIYMMYNAKSDEIRDFCLGRNASTSSPIHILFFTGLPGRWSYASPNCPVNKITGMMFFRHRQAHNVIIDEAELKYLFIIEELAKAESYKSNKELSPGMPCIYCGKPLSSWNGIFPGSIPKAYCKDCEK